MITIGECNQLGEVLNEIAELRENASRLIQAARDTVQNNMAAPRKLNN